MAYLRDARLQVRTKRDTDLLQKFETSIQLAKDASETKDRIWKDTLDSLRSAVSMDTHADRLLAIRGQYLHAGVRPPKDLDDQISRAIADEKAERKQKEEMDQADSKRADEEAKKAQELYKEVRADLGLPPLPEPKGK